MIGLAPDAACDVAVLLATFNGAAFLRSQLSSLLEQQEVSWRLFWRDDGSSDGSVAVMEDFAREAPLVCTRVAAPAARLGVARSYQTLVEHAPPGTTIAFCDQDDVWLPHKLARGHAALRDVPDGVPALYCARQRLVDARLRPLGESMKLRHRPEFPMALTQNIATGCTVMLNAAAADLLRAAPPPPGTLHDWWSYLLVAGAAGRLIVDDEAVVLYRQHDSNLVGAPSSYSRRAVAAVRRGPAVFMRVLREHVDTLAAYEHLLSPPSRRANQAIREALRSGAASRVRVLLRYRLRRQTWPETVLFGLWFVIG